MLKSVQYTALFNRDDRSLRSSTPRAAALSSIPSLDDSIPDTYRSPPRPLPYDADPRFFRLHRDVSSSEKGSSHQPNEETELLTEDEGSRDSDPTSNKSKWSDFTHDDASKEYNSKSSVKQSTDKPATGYAHIYTGSDDEDVCPTCLEGILTISQFMAH